MHNKVSWLILPRQRRSMLPRNEILAVPYRGERVLFTVYSALFQANTCSLNICWPKSADVSFSVNP